MTCTIVLFFFSLILILGFSFLFGAEMTSKFNKDMYAKIKAKKNEPLSSIGQKTSRITDKEKEKEAAERGSSTPTLDEGRTASPAISIEKVPAPKRLKTGYKGKEKMGSNICADAEPAMARANEFLTPKEMKEISLVPSHKMVSQHVHNLVQVIFLLPYYSFLFC